MAKRSAVFKATRVILTILVVVISLMIVTAAIVHINRDDIVIIESILSLLGGAVIVYILINLKLIVDTAAKNPFCEVNISRFRAIGYSIFGIGLLHLIETLPQQKGAVLIGTPYGSIHVSVLVFAVLGFMALLLSEIFAEALEIKKDNDMTV